MRHFTIITFLLFSLNTFSQNENPCEKFKTGTFKYAHENYKDHLIIRNDSIQIETNNRDDIKIITSIRWVSDCKYILKYVDILNYSKKENLIGKEIYVEIIETRKDSYKCIVKSDNTDALLEFIKD